MEFFQAQTFLGNFSFSILFLLMLFYWIEASFFSISQYHFLGFFGTVLVNLSLALLLFLRWFEEGHFPLSNLYESLIFLSWSFTFIHIILEKTTHNLFIGVITSPIALFTNAFGAFTLPAEMQKASSLVPALQSNWLMMHVTIMILSYASLIIGSLFAILFLVISFYEEDREKKLTLLSARNQDLLLPALMKSEISKEAEQSKEDNIDEEIVLNLLPALTLKSCSARISTSLLPALTQSELHFDTSKCKEQGQKIINQNFAQSLTVPLSLVMPAKASNIYLNNIWNIIPLAFKMFHFNVRAKAKFKFLQELLPLKCFILTSEQRGQRMDYSLLSRNLDNLSYRILGVGFPLLTIGILSGAVWANEAWGSYWSWDPKETWALITWLTYAIYLHTRITNGWSGKRSAILASLGFIVVWICYLGVNLLGKGLHSYGWVQSLNNLF